MEKQSNLRNKLLKILPKAAAAVTVTFQNPPFSPGRDHKLRSHGLKGFSGPMIPDEARRKPKDGGIETQEPTSPKVSCMGQIKHKKKRVSKVKKGKSMSLNSHHAKNVVVVDVDIDNSTPGDKNTKKQNESSKFQRMFFTKSAARKTENKSSVSSVTDRSAPPLGEMRRFASGRDTFSNFDWTAQIAPEEIHQRDCFTDDERVESDEDDVTIPFSAPLTIGAGSGRNALNVKPRKEINLWKRRTMEPPSPLQLNPVLTAK